MRTPAPPRSDGPAAALISVIVPTYDRPDMLQATLRSILEQTGPELELLVIDDSGRASARDAVAGLGDPRLRYFALPENRGLARARNFGIAQARGGFLAFCDDDDLWLPRKLELQASFMKEHPAARICYTACTFLFPDGTRARIGGGPLTAADLLTKNRAVLSALIRRDCFTRAGLFDETLPVCEDYDMWLRLAEHFPIDYLDIPTVEIRYHDSNMSGDADRIADYNIRVAETALGRLRRGLSPAELRRAESSILFRKGKRAFFRGDRRDALRHFAASWIRQPSNPRPLGFLPFCLLGTGVFRRVLPMYERLRATRYQEFG